MLLLTTWSIIKNAVSHLITQVSELKFLSPKITEEEMQPTSPACAKKCANKKGNNLGLCLSWCRGYEEALWDWNVSVGSKGGRGVGVSAGISH